MGHQIGDSLLIDFNNNLFTLFSIYLVKKNLKISKINKDLFKLLIITYKNINI